MTGAGYTYDDVRAYLKALGFDRDHSISNLEYWENPAGKVIIVSVNNDSLPLSMLDEILTDLCKTMTDFRIFVEARSKDRVVVEE